MFNEKRAIKIWGKEYIVNFPKVGQLIDIENVKQVLTSGQYGVLARTNTIETNYILDLVDSVATFSVLIPELKEEFPKSSYLDLEMEKAKALVIAFRKQYEPWYSEIRQQFMVIMKDEIEEAETVKQ